MSFIAEAQEGGMTNTSAYESETLEEQPVYVVDNVDSYQDCDGYHVSYSVTNTGNTPSNAGDTMKVIFSGPYAMAAGLTPEECNWGSVKYAAEKGYFAGVSEDTFEPDTNVTRGMLITVIGRMNGVKPENTDMTYTDVNKDIYYAPYIAWGTENGIVSGYSDTEFAPDELVTREQVAAMLWRYAQYIGKDVSVGENTNILSYADAAEANDYAVPAIQWACGSGIMSGYTDNTLRPQNNATRAEAAALTERFDKTIK